MAQLGLACLLGVQEVAGSNPAAPIFTFQRSFTQLRATARVAETLAAFAEISIPAIQCQIVPSFAVGSAKGPPKFFARPTPRLADKRARARPRREFSPSALSTTPSAFCRPVDAVDEDIVTGRISLDENDRGTIPKAPARLKNVVANLPPLGQTLRMKNTHLKTAAAAGKFCAQPLSTPADRTEQKIVEMKKSTCVHHKTD